MRGRSQQEEETPLKPTKWLTEHPAAREEFRAGSQGNTENIQGLLYLYPAEKLILVQTSGYPELCSDFSSTASGHLVTEGQQSPRQEEQQIPEGWGPAQAPLTDFSTTCLSEWESVS